MIRALLTQADQDWVPDELIDQIADCVDNYCGVVRGKGPGGDSGNPNTPLKGRKGPSGASQTQKTSQENVLTAKLIHLLSLFPKRRKTLQNSITFASKCLWDQIRRDKATPDQTETAIFFLTAAAAVCELPSPHLCDVVLAYLDRIKLIPDYEIDGVFLRNAFLLFGRKQNADSHSETTVLFAFLGMKWLIRNAELSARPSLPAEGPPTPLDVLQLEERWNRECQQDGTRGSDLLAFVFGPSQLDPQSKGDPHVYDPAHSVARRVAAKKSLFKEISELVDSCLKNRQLSEERLSSMLLELEEKVSVLLMDRTGAKKSGRGSRESAKEGEGGCSLHSLQKIGAETDASSAQNRGFFGSAFSSLFGSTPQLTEEQIQQIRLTKECQAGVILQLIRKMIACNPICALYKDIFFVVMRVVNAGMNSPTSSVRLLAVQISQLLFKMAETDHQKANMLINFLASSVAHMPLCPSIVSLFTQNSFVLSDQRIEHYRVIILNALLKCLRWQGYEGIGNNEKEVVTSFLGVCRRENPDFFNEVMKTVELIIFRDILEHREKNHRFLVGILPFLNDFSGSKSILEDIWTAFYLPRQGKMTQLALRDRPAETLLETTVKEIRTVDVLADPSPLLLQAELLSKLLELPLDLDLRPLLADLIQWTKFTLSLRSPNTSLESKLLTVFQRLLESGKLGLNDLLQDIRTELTSNSQEGSAQYPFQSHKGVLPGLVRLLDAWLERADFRGLQSSEILKLAKQCFEVISLYNSNEFLGKENQKTAGFDLLSTFLLKFMSISENGGPLDAGAAASLSHTYLIQVESILRSEAKGVFGRSFGFVQSYASCLEVAFRLSQSVDPSLLRNASKAASEVTGAAQVAAQLKGAGPSEVAHFLAQLDRGHEAGLLMVLSYFFYQLVCEEELGRTSSHLGVNGRAGEVQKYVQDISSRAESDLPASLKTGLADFAAKKLISDSCDFPKIHFFARMLGSALIQTGPETTLAGKSLSYWFFRLLGFLGDGSQAESEEGGHRISLEDSHLLARLITKALTHQSEVVSAAEAEFIIVFFEEKLEKVVRLAQTGRPATKSDLKYLNRAIRRDYLTQILTICELVSARTDLTPPTLTSLDKINETLQAQDPRKSLQISRNSLAGLPMTQSNLPLVLQSLLSLLQKMSRLEDEPKIWEAARQIESFLANLKEKMSQSDLFSLFLNDFLAQIASIYLKSGSPKRFQTPTFDIFLYLLGLLGPTISGANSEIMLEFVGGLDDTALRELQSANSTKSEEVRARLTGLTIFVVFRSLHFKEPPRTTLLIALTSSHFCTKKETQINAFLELLTRLADPAALQEVVGRAVGQFPANFLDKLHFENEAVKEMVSAELEKARKLQKFKAGPESQPSEPKKMAMPKLGSLKSLKKG